MYELTVCTYCWREFREKQIADEIHLLIVCPFYQDIRNKYRTTLMERKTKLVSKARAYMSVYATPEGLDEEEVDFHKLMNIFSLTHPFLLARCIIAMLKSRREYLVKCGVQREFGCVLLCDACFYIYLWVRYACIHVDVIVLFLLTVKQRIFSIVFFEHFVVWKFSSLTYIYMYTLCDR